MAVKDIIPKTNVKAVDIRDTLLAHGADWSNSATPNANYLPNYFRKESKINKWSRYKPMELGRQEYDPTDNDYKKSNWGIKPRVYSYQDRNSMYDDYMNGVEMYSYVHPEPPFRLADFRGYNPNASSPINVEAEEQIECVGVTELIPSVRPFPLEYELGFGEILEGYNHHGVRIKTKSGKVIWVTSPIDWERIKLILPNGNTEAEMFEFMSTEPFYEFSGEPISAMIAPLQDDKNPYMCKLIIEKAPRLELLGTIVYREVGAEVARLLINYSITNISEDANVVTLGDLTVHSKLDWDTHFTFIGKDNIAGIVLPVKETHEGFLSIDVYLSDIDFMLIKLEMVVTVGDYETETYTFEGYARPFDMFRLKKQ